jgi:hypothetical protein
LAGYRRNVDKAQKKYRQSDKGKKWHQDWGKKGGQTRKKKKKLTDSINNVIFKVIVERGTYTKHTKRPLG